MRSLGLLCSVALCCLACPEQAAAQKAALCDYMSGSILVPKSALLAPAAEKAKQGDFAGGYKAANEVLNSFSSTAAALFFEAPTPATLDQARALIAEQLLAADGVLAVRGDFFTARPDVVDWMAWLACKAGSLDASLFWLRLGTRDYPLGQYNAQAALPLLVAGKKDEAKKHLVEKPELVFHFVALGWHACVTGETKIGAAHLEKAATIASSSEAQKQLRDWSVACAAGKLKE